MVAIFEHKRSSRPLLRPRHKRLFQLLFQHSCRWWAAEFYGSVDIDSSCLQAKFPLLRHLTLQVEQKAEMLATSPHTVDFFVGVAPTLKTLNVNPESLDMTGTVAPFRQLSELRFFAVKPETVVRAVSLAYKLPQGTRLHMTLFHRPNITVPHTFRPRA